MDWTRKWPFFIVSVFFVSLSGLADGQTGSPSSLRTVSISVDATPGQVITNFTMPFSAVNYTIAGSSAPGRFSVDANTGELSLAQSIQSDVASDYFIVVFASDGGSPSRVAYETVRVTVDRNLFDPEWTNPGSLQGFTASTSVLETIDFASLIYYLNATDRDQSGPQSTITYEMVDTSSGNLASTYFRVTISGQIYVRSSLTGSSFSTVTFEVQAQDAGVPVRQSNPNARVTINVIRNQFPPVFQREPYNTSLPFTTGPSVSVYTVSATDADTRNPFNVVRYSLIGDDQAPAMFTIDPVSGQINTRTSLGTDILERYVLRVVAADGGTPSLTDTSTVVVTVQRNLNSPEVFPQNYTVTILEEQALGVPIIRVSASDRDVSSPYNQLTFTEDTTLTDAETQEYFGIGASTGDVSVQKDLILSTRNPNSNFVLTVQVCDAGNPPRCAPQRAFVTIRVIRNRNTPYFINLPYDQSLQTLQVGSVVTTATARDDDDAAYKYGQVTYSLIGDDGAPAIFQIDATTGAIRVRSSPTTTSDRFRIRIQACDGGNLCNTTVAIISLRTNFLAPEFSPLPANYQRTVPETITLGEVILDLNATDRDPTAPNNVVSFAITEGPEDQACFQINSVTGELFAKRSLLVDPCTANIFNMIVTASDGGSPSLSATASVAVFVQRNQNPPVFQNEPYQAQIDENTAVNTLVATVTATDADLVAPMNTIFYTITGEGTAPTFFSINKINNNNAEIRLQSSVLSDSRTSYTLQVRAFDGGSPPKEDVTTVITSVNRNLFPPEIFPLEYNVTILESQLLGLEIIRVNGSDRDSKAPHNVLSYEPTGNALAQEYFNIQANTGAVYIQKDLRADTAKTTLYLLSVRVRDQGTPVRVSTQTALVRINVLRNSNCPRFQNLPATITINQTTTGIIYTATATDSDSGVFGSVEYSISGDDNAPSLFTIFRISGQVQVQNALAGDTGNVYRVRVQATDFGSPVCSVQEVLTVNVLRNLFPPVFDSVNYNVTILETHPLSSSIFTLTARDQDSGVAGTVRYEVAASSQNQNLFYVEAVTGQVFLRSSQVGVTGDPYVLTVLARDNGLPSRSATQTLTVRVIRNLFPPEFVNEPYQVSIDRTRPVSSPVFQVSARDNDTTDPYNRVRFRIFGDDDAPAIFTINNVSGQILLQTAVPDNSITTYRIRVLAEDGGTPVRTDAAVVIVTVNRNQNDPMFVTLNYAQTILETQTVGLSIVKVSATDADTQAPFNEVRYEILGNDTVREFFQVDTVTGDVSLRRSMLDYPVKSTPQVFQFQVTARDNTIAPRQAPQPASVTITLIRNTAPFFLNSPYTTSLQENATAGSSVFQTSGRDNDRNTPFNSLSYSLLGDGAASTLFQVDSNGLITVRANAALATDRSTTYTVRVAVVDGGSPPLSAVTTVTVNMIRNFHAPRFLHGSIVQQIPEGTAVGTLIADANATDDDVVAPLNQVTYQMVSGNSQADQYMFVNPTTGAIILLKSVAPPETISRFLFSIEARDGGSPPRTGQVSVDVTVLRTQGQLAFDAPNYNVTISENRPVGDPITTVRAQPGTSITYTVTGLSSGPSYFSVNSVSGQVTIRTDLRNDASRITFYQLVVVAERTDISRQTATATVNIWVIRNEFGPQFGQLLSNVTISDTISLGTEVVMVSASDRDNDTVEYRMMSGPPSTEVFFLNPRTGVISLAQVIRGNNVNKYQFLVQASDQRSPPKTQNATVIVNVIHDLSPPRFINLPSTVPVREDTANGTSIFIVSAQDSDLKGQLVFGVSGVGVAQAYFTLMTTGTSSSNPRSANVMLVDSPAFRNATQSAYQLRVTVYDSAYPETVAESFLNITAERNLNSPIFGLGPYQKTINESQPLGVSLVQVQATDGDGDSLLYSIIGDARAREFYYIDPLTGIISLKKSMTEGTQTTDIIQIQARDQRTPERFGSTTATITIIRDAFPPQFQNLPYITSLNIGRPNGSDVLTARATDADLKGIIIYEVTGIFPAQAFFAVDSTSGMVRLIRPLSEDGQNLNQYLLRLIAYDSVYPNQRATATATISVNRNPSAPACQPPNLSLDIAETLPIGSIVADINATDADGDPLTYRLVSGDPEDNQFFFVYPSDGRVALNRRLTDSNTANFVFEVEASDGSRTCITTLALRVVRDAPPVFVNEPYSTQFVETRPVGDSVYTVRATDPDIKGQIIYNAVGRYQATRFFSVNNTTGSVQIIQNLMTDILSSYELVVTAYDSGSPGKTATATVFISVTRNPNPPALGLPSYSATVEELIPVSSSIVNVTATDPDGDTLRYEFVGTPLTNKALQIFSINADDGRVVLTRRLTEDTDVRYIMTVRVRDQRTPEQSALGTVTINVLRNQQPPVFQNLPYNQQLSENTLASSSVYAVRAVDPDLRGSIMYEAVGDDQATYFFRIHPNTGNITLVNSLRTDRSLTYTLRIQAYDSAYPLDRATATVLFTIRRNENSPVWITSPYRVTINETTAVGTSILRINASDLDTGDVVRYVSVGETDTLDLFWLNPDTGDISVIRPLKPGTKSSYRMVVEARDSGYPTRTATVEVFITILRDQGPPVFQNLPYFSTQNEFITTGSFIQDVVARDPDLKGQIVYQLDGIYPAPTFFSLDNSTGLISLASSLKNDPERKNQYLLRLLAWDSAVPDMRATATATVNVIRNPSPPTWGLPEYRATIPEDHPVLAPVVNVSATDTDPGDVISYAILQETAQRDLNAGPADYFFIDTTTGAISLRKSVLGTGIVSFRLLVQACDSGVPQRCISTNVTITVDRSGQFPVFINLPYTSTINETAVPSQSIRAVSATDPDLKGQIAYELETGTGFFALDRTTGVISLARSVQNDLSISYTFNVVAYDSLDVPRKATAQVTIIVTRNLNSPVFLESPYQTTISEYHRVGSSVINTTAVDLDGDTVRYSIVSTDPGITSRFFINPQNGIIYLSQSLENTQVVRFDLTVQASDQRAVNAKVANVQVTILVDLDEYPRFASNPYTTTIPETYNVSSRVMTITATDRDLQGQITYMTDGIFPSERLFSLNTVSGEITLTRGLMTSDALNLNEYRMNVIAYDSAYPQRRATSTVIITVTRNPNAPQFQAPSYDVTVSETRAVGSSVVNISAVDQDGDPVTYAITADTSGLQNYFYLDPRNGRVIITSDLTKTPQDIYIATVTASDSRGRTASVSLTIRITRITDRPPFFVNTPYRRDLLVSQPINTVIYTVTAQDSDLQGRLEYAAVGLYPALNFFSINSTTGQISLTNSLRQDNLSSVQYTIRVEACDTAFPNTRASENVFIVVNRNPNRPVFDSAGYVVTIPETQAVGSSILRMNATDQDGDTVQYYIQNDALGVAANNYFFISAFTGIVYVKQDLTTTNQNRFQFTGLAFDNGVPQNSAPISVIINIERDGGRPQFTQTVYTVPIPETTPVNDTLPVITVTANDADQKGTIRYVATGDGLALAYFWIDQNGRIYVRTPLLGVVTSRFDMIVEAYDDQYPNNRGSSLVVITVIRNPNTPTFGQSQYTASVFEYDPAGTLVVNTSATDRDGDSVRYSLQGSAEVATYFYVDDRTGIVYLRQPVSPNPSNQYSFFVEASDQRSPAKVGQATVLVTVQRDQFPRLTNLPGFIALNEDTAASTSVFTVTAQDSNLRGALRYELIGDGVSPNFFQINNVTGVISTSAGLSQDINRNYVVRVVVYDTAIPSARVTGVLTVTVNRNANAPQCQQSPYVVSVDEGASIGSLVLNVSATDADIGDTLRYEMINQGDAANYFFVDGSTGRVYLTRSVSGIQSNQFQFQVQARDRIGQPSLLRTANCDVNVTITKDTSLPVFVGLPYIVSPAVLETVAINSTVFSGVRATNADLKGSIIYEATGIYPATSFFGVDRNTGVVRVIQNLKSDGLALDTYRLEVIAYDSAKPDARATATVTISVVHNPSIPTFRSQSYVASIDETTNVGLSIISVNASDADGDTITYSITGDNNNGQSFNFFYIDPRTGVVYLRQLLVGTTINRFDMTVTAVDNGRPSRSNQANLVINVNRIQAPGFVGTPYQTTVREDQTVGASFFSVRASKTHPTGTIMYRAVGLGSAPYFFTVNNVTGDLVVLRDLRQGTESQYTLRMQAYDSAFSTFTSETDIVINMLRNPNSPVLNGPYTTQVGGQATAGTVVINVTATDLDGDRITYQLIGDARCRDVFFIEADTGIVRVNRNLNTVNDAQFDCTVQASDNARPTPKTTTSPLTITVVRQNLPVFATSPYRATVNENDGVGLPVLRVNANKPPPSGTIIYEMIGVYPAPTLFRLDNVTGEISIAVDLSTDPVKLTMYTVRVVAYDVQYPDLRSTADALITVNRNQNGPVFTPSSISLQLPESTNPASWSLTLTVTAPDSWVVTCSTTGDQKAQEYFQVNSSTCVVSLRKNLTTDLDLTTTYRLFVSAVATNGISPSATAVAVVSVTVNRNLFAPDFSQSQYSVLVRESLPVGAVVLTLSAPDRDTVAPYNTVNYHILGNDSDSVVNFFRINSTSGQIILNDSLQNAPPIVQLTVEARDGGQAQRSQQVQVDVTVLEKVLRCPDTSSPTTIGTTLPAVTAAPNLDPGCPRTSASLGDMCGNSTTVTHLCTTPYSACVRGAANSLPVCRCTGGRVGRAGSPPSCEPAPTSMLTSGGNLERSATIFSNAGINTSVLTLTLYNLTSLLEVTPPRAQLLPDTGVFKAEVGSNQLEVKVNGVLNPGVATLAVIVSASVGGIPVQSVVLLKVTVRPEVARAEVVLLADGSPRDSVVFEASRVVPGLQPDAYSLTDVTQVFGVDSSGRVTTRSSLNVSALASAQALTWDSTFGVTARVQGSDVTLANVRVVVTRPRVVTSVREDAAVGTVVVRGAFLQQPTNLPPGLQFNASEIRVARALDFERGDREFYFQLTVLVGGRASTSDVIVNVINVNDNGPVLQQAALTSLVATGSYPGTLVAGLEASDADGDTLTYRLLPGGFSSLFELNSRGLLRSNVNLTRASFGGRSNFSVNVEVSDGQYTQTGTVFIYIVNVTTEIANLERNYNALVPEGEAPRVIADLYDSNYTKYEFLKKNTSFTIHPINGTVRTTQPLDREQRDSYPLNIVAVETNSDGCSLVVLGTLTITVEDKNDNTPSLPRSSYSASVLEEENNTLVLEMTAQDADAGINGTLTFTLQGTGSNNFLVASTGQRSAQIRTRVHLDRETVSSYQLAVVVRDGGIPALSTSASLSISVTDKNDNPPRITPTVSNITVNENTEATFAHAISFSDPDEGQNANAVLSVAGDLASSFYVNASNVLLIKPDARQVLDREQRSSYTILLLAVDKGNPALTGTGSVIITVQDVNDNSPQFGVTMTARVAEDASCSVPFFSLTATDSDAGINAQVNFTVCPSASPSATAALQVDSQGGVRCRTGQLDFETLPRLELCVQVADQGIPSRTTTGTLVVQVEDANDNSPVFSPASFSVNVSSNDAKTGRPLVVTSASDRDSGLNGKVVFSLSGADAGRFRVDQNSGLVEVGGQDLQAAEYRVTVQASDQGTPPRSSQTSLTVTVFQAASTTFTFNPKEFNFTVSEDARVNSSVGQTTANGALRYSIVNNVSPFQILNNGTLTLSSPLDRERNPSYVLVVEAENANSERTLAKVQVMVDDVNDNDPVFVTTVFYRAVSEGEGIGFYVISISATDADVGSNANLQYSLSPNEAFTIDSTSGRVNLSRSLDRERTPQYDIIVTVADQGIPSRQASKNLIIVVEDINDNPPIISLASSFNVPENQAASQRVIEGTFSDLDLDKNSWVTLTIPPPCPLQVGFYNKETGFGRFELLLNETLDFEATQNYTCRLQAVNDRSSVSLSSSVEFTVLVHDVNDNAPVFEEGSSFALNVSRAADEGVQLFPGTRVTDRDSGLNAAITFSLQGDRQDYFKVNGSSGAIWLEKQVDFDEENIELQLVARNPTDAATSTPNYATATLNIAIEDDNYRPYFTARQQSVNVTEERMQGSLMAVRAFDRVDNTPVTCDCNYSIFSVRPPGARDVLELSQAEGGDWELRLTAVLDRENDNTGASIEVVLTATDSGQPPKTGSTTVTIEVLDVNDNGPVFSASPLTLYVEQTRPLGWRVEPAVSATDADTGENAVTVYELVSFTSTGSLTMPFYVDSSTGHLVVNGSLSLPDVTSDLLALVLVRATDPGNNMVNLKSVTVVMSYINPNNAPVFSKAVYVTNVEKNAFSRTPVHLPDFSITDPDNDTVTVMIVAGNKRDLFAYNATERQFYVQYMLDNTPTFNLTLVAQDRPSRGQSKTSAAILIIQQLEPEALVCEAQSLYNSNTAKRQNFTILFAVFCAVTGLLLLGLIFVIYKWRMAANAAKTNVEPSTYTSIGRSQENIKKPYSTLAQGMRNPAYSYAASADPEDVHPYLDSPDNPPPLPETESRQPLSD